MAAAQDKVEGANAAAQKQLLKVAKGSKIKTGTGRGGGRGRGRGGAKKELEETVDAEADRDLELPHEKPGRKKASKPAAAETAAPPAPETAAKPCTAPQTAAKPTAPQTAAKPSAPKTAAMPAPEQASEEAMPKPKCPPRKPRAPKADVDTDFPKFPEWPAVVPSLIYFWLMSCLHFSLHLQLECVCSEARELQEANIPLPEKYKGETKSFTLPAHKYSSCPDGSSIGIMHPACTMKNQILNLHFLET